MITVIDYWATWCGPCKMMGPVIESLMEKYNVDGSEVEVSKVEVDTLKPAELAELGIKSIPTIIISKDGKEASRFVGVQNKETLIEAIDSLQ